MIMLLPLCWLLSFLVAVSVHELFHYIAVCLCGGKIIRIKVGSSGMIMEISPLSPGKELICALSGPLGSLLISLWIHRFQMIGLCSVFHLVYNMLPVYPLDGGRAIHCVLNMMFSPTRSERITLWISKCFLLILFLAGAFTSWYYSLGIIPVLIPVVLWLRIQNQDKT